MKNTFDIDKFKAAYPHIEEKIENQNIDIKYKWVL